MVMQTVHSCKVAQHPSTGEALTRQNYRELLARIEAQKEVYRQSDEPPQPRRKVMSKSHPYNVVDVAALKAAYPQLVTERTEVVQDVDHAKLYQLVKVKTLLGEPMPAGVELKVKKGAAETEGASAEAAPAASSEA